MKKLLVLLLIAGMASMASAQLRIVIVLDGGKGQSWMDVGDEITVPVATTLRVGVYNETAGQRKFYTGLMSVHVPEGDKWVQNGEWTAGPDAANLKSGTWNVYTPPAPAGSKSTWMGNDEFLGPYWGPISTWTTDCTSADKDAGVGVLVDFEYKCKSAGDARIEIRDDAYPDMVYDVLTIHQVASK